MSVNYPQVFHDSLERTVSNEPEKFFQRFYDRFMEKSPAVRDHFEGVDMAKQRLMLMASLAHMVEFAEQRVPSDYMKSLAMRHSHRDLNVVPVLYDLWLDTLVETVEERDPEFDDQVGVAWRVVMAPGIAYMKAHY